MDQISNQITEALAQIYTKEIHIIAGKHMQRAEGRGVFRFIPGHTRAMLLNDVNLFTEHFVACSRGVGFNIRLKETNARGVSLEILTNVCSARGHNLVDRA